MTKLAELSLPEKMSPVLASRLALVFTRSAKPNFATLYVALAFLHASWAASEAAPVRDYGDFLKVTVLPLNSLTASVQLMSQDGFYTAQAEASAVPPELLEATLQAVHHWSALLLQQSEQFLAGVWQGLLTWLNQLDSLDEATTTDMVAVLESLLANSAAADADELALPATPVESEEDSRPLPYGMRTLPSGKVVVRIKGVELAEFDNSIDAMRFLFSHSSSDTAQGVPVAEEGGDGSCRPSGTTVDGRATHQLFNPLDVTALLNRAPPPKTPMDGNAQQRSLLEQMRQEDGRRRLSEVPAGTPLVTLYQRFPHFSEVLDFVAESLALAGCGEEGRPVRIPPMLLRGTPGTGKTYFAQELARVLGAEFQERDLSVTSESWVISGMDASWKNSKQGLVFDALVHGETANPVICLNEVDKACGHGDHGSPIAALYSLLEPASSVRFVDEFAPVPLDASKVGWILTANHAPIPEPILSRLEVFEIPVPTRQQCREIAQSVWDSLLSQALPKGHGFATQLDEAMLDLISAMSPRSMRKALTRAASRAALEKRRTLSMQDLADTCKRYAEDTERRSIGFMA